jgi:hypothetical protein
MATKLPKGTEVKIVKTTGKDAGQYDLYNLCGLSLGKLLLIQRSLKLNAANGDVLAAELVAQMGTLDENQTMNGK